MFGSSSCINCVNLARIGRQVTLRLALTKRTPVGFKVRETSDCTPD
jgi:hypothetical protein